MGNIDAIVNLLDESLITIHTISTSRYSGPFTDDIHLWQQDLTTMRDVFRQMVNCQKSCGYLDSIFRSIDIQKQLVMESKMYFEVDTFWRQTMKFIQQNPNVRTVLLQEDFDTELDRHNKSLDTISKELDDFLETKRFAFPRFHFISNDELLQILSIGRDIQAVQSHVRKCFDGIWKFSLVDDSHRDRDTQNVSTIISVEGESVAVGRLKQRSVVDEFMMLVEENFGEQIFRVFSEMRGKFWYMDPNVFF